MGARYDDGATIFAQGTLGESAYVIQKGKVALLKAGPDGGEKRLTILKKGEIFGLTGLLGSDQRLFTARAKGEAFVMRLDRQVLVQRMHQDPSVAFGILSKTLKRTQELFKVQKEQQPGLGTNEGAQEMDRLALMRGLSLADREAAQDQFGRNWSLLLEQQLHRLRQASLFQEGYSSGQMGRIAKQRRKELKVHLQENGIDTARCERYLSRFYDDYFLHHGLPRMAGHQSTLMEMKRQDPLIAFLPLADTTRVEMMVATQEHPLVLSALSGAVALLGVSIIALAIHPMRDGTGLYLLELVRPSGDLMAAASCFGQIRQMCRDLLSRQLDPGELLASAQVMHNLNGTGEVEDEPSEAMQVSELDAPQGHTLIRISAPDRVGLLFAITQELARHRVRILSARLHTHAGRAVDLFMLQDVMGGAVAEKKLAGLMDGLRQMCLGTNTQ